MKKNKPDTFAEFMQWASFFNYISYCRSDKSINLYEYHELCYQRYLECFNEVQCIHSKTLRELIPQLLKDAKI